MSSLVSNIQNLRRKSPLIFFFLLHTVIFLLLFAILEQLFYFSPGGMELAIARRIKSGQIPYRDFVSEYPPLALLSFVLPMLVFSENPAYSLAFAFEMLLLDFLILRLIARLTPRLGMPPERAMGIYTVLLLAVGPITISRYDLLPAALTLGAIAAFVSGANLTSWALVALGTTAKMYPIIIAPLMGLFLLRNKQFGKIITGSFSFALTLLLGNLPFYLMNPRNFMGILTYHAARDIQSESTYASAVLVAKILNLTGQVRGVFGYGSWNIASPLADKLAKVAFPVSVVLLLAVYATYAWQSLRKPPSPLTKGGMASGEALSFVRFSALSIAIFLVSSKVFSPQFLIWLMPLLPLLDARLYTARWFLFVVIGLLTQYIFPYNYTAFEYFQTPYVLIIALRNLLTIGLSLMILLSGKTNGKQGAFNLEAPHRQDPSRPDRN